MTSINRPVATQQVVLAPPSALMKGNTGSSVGVNPLNKSDQYANTNVIPNNYPEITNNIPASIFPQEQTAPIPTQNQGSVGLPPPGNVAGAQAGAAPVTGGSLKPVSMTEAQWAVKFEEKVQKQNYQAPPEEMAKYQDIVARFKANPKIDNSILEILASQSTSLGAQVASMRYGKVVTEGLRGLKPGAGSSIGGVTGAVETGAIGGLKSIGGSLLKGSGLGAVVSGGFSLITNGIQVLQGKKTWSDAGGTVAADSIGGAISGITGTVGAGLAGLIVGGTGLLPTLVVGLGAMGGAWLGDKLFKGTGMYDKVKDSVSTMIDSGIKPQTYTPQFNNTAQAR